VDRGTQAVSKKLSFKKKIKKIYACQFENENLDRWAAFHNIYRKENEDDASFNKRYFERVLNPMGMKINEEEHKQ